MIYKNIELYNVSETEDGEYGKQLMRFPKAVAQKCGERIINASYAASGVELRFNIEDEEAEITLRTPGENTSTIACLYRGDISGGWQDVVYRIYSTPTKIKIKRHEQSEVLEKMSSMCGYSYDCNLIRILFPVSKIEIIDVKGKVSPPRREQLPSLRYLAYGSSITHGSLGILPMNTYAYRTAHALDAQLINLGVAGSAYMEDAMAEYIAERNDFDFATLEMGINVMNAFSIEEYDKAVRNFITKIASAHSDKKIFCIDMVYSNFDMEGNKKANDFRAALKKAVEELGFKNTVYINGLTLMNSAKFLSADFIHPSVWGCEEISRNLSEIIKKHINF